MKHVKLTIEYKLNIKDEELEEIIFLLKKNGGKIVATSYVKDSDDDSYYIYFPTHEGHYQEGTPYINLLCDAYEKLISLQVKDEWADKWRRDAKD